MATEETKTTPKPEALTDWPEVKRSGRKTKYPYGEWFELAEKSKNGIKLVQGVHFECSTSTARHNLYRHAKLNGLDSDNFDTVMLKGENGDEVGIAIRVQREKASK